MTRIAVTRRRWLAGGLGLLLAAAAGWALATWPGAARPPAEPEAREAPPHADIGEPSRERLRELLRREDAREAREREARP